MTAGEAVIDQVSGRGTLPQHALRPCRHPRCPSTTRDPSGYCDAHRQESPARRAPDTRAPASRRGYGAEWRRIRAEVLTAHGIPRDQWSRYHVDHRPAYNPDVEPDHRKYQLVPMLAADHNRKTAQEDGGFGHRRRVGGSKSLGGQSRNRTMLPVTHTGSNRVRGAHHE